MSRPRPRPLVFGCACLAIITSLSAAPTEPPAVDPYVELHRANERLTAENENLKRQVADLTANLRRLEEQLVRAKVRAAPAPPRPQPFQMPGSELRRGAPGHDWIPREFNGQTVYIIPCETGAATAGRTGATSATSAGAVEVKSVPRAVAAPTDAAPLAPAATGLPK